MRIIAVEDEPLFASTIERLIDELGYNLVSIVDNSEAMLRSFVATKPDLALIDINIKGTMDGIEVARRISQSEYAVPIIFITSFKDKITFERAMETLPYAYIVKPFDEELLQRTIEVAFHRYSNKNHAIEKIGWQNDILVRDSFFIKNGQKLEKVKVKDIFLVEIQDKYANIHTFEKTYVIRMPLKELLEKLPATDFIQVHRTFIVNANYMDNIDLKENIISILNREIPISKIFLPILLSRLNTI